MPRKPSTRPASHPAFDAATLRTALTGALRLLERHYAAINALNVFPVPDGDTGTNMLLTFRDITAALPPSNGTLGALAAAAARGGVLGARGNSGVIFSQYLSGFTAAFQGKDSLTASDLATAFEAAGAASYKAVGEPVEGTMLTVAREAGVAAKARAARPKADALAVADAALSGAKVSLKRTPELLPALKDAGVVDAGGQGLVVVLEALAAALRGVDVDTLDVEIAGTPTGGTAQVSEAFLQQVEGETYGFCTQLLLQGKALDIDGIRAHLAAMAQSTAVVGDPTVVKVHVHTETPDEVVAYAKSLGTVSDVKMENIDAMHRDFAERHRRARPKVAVAVVAVAWGDGFAQVFADLGIEVVRCGRTMNPSAKDLLNAAEASGGAAVVFLPNNPNVVATARQAAKESTTKPLHVVPTRTLPQGVAAALAWSPEQSIEANVEAMTEASASVKTIEVVRAARDSVVDGRPVRTGETMGLLNDRLSCVGNDPADVLLQTLRASGAGQGSLVTLYWGGALDAGAAEAAAARVPREVAGAEVELVPGGQPFYEFIASVE